MNRSSTKIDVVEDVELGQVHKCNQEVHYWHTGQDVSRQTYLVVQLQQSAPSFITKGNHEKPIKLTPPQTFPQPDVSASPFLAQKKSYSPRNRGSDHSHPEPKCQWHIAVLFPTKLGYTWSGIYLSRPKVGNYITKCQWHPSTTKTSEFVILIHWPTEMDLR